MIFCEKLLFLHVPKAAGSSLTQVLLERLPRPTYYTHPEDFYEGRDDGVIHLPGGAHETLAEAGEIIASYGFELSDLGVILGVVRNPYALEVSRYFYLRTANPYDIGYNQALALTSDFETFALKSKPHGWLKRPIESYFTLDGEVPPNMRILRMEHLLEDLNAALETVALPPVENLPATNTSDHGHFIDYYTPRAEKSVFERYRWLFDQGFYQRIDPKQLVGTQTGGMAPSADSTIQSGSMVSPEELAAPLILLAHDASTDVRARIIGALLADVDERTQAEALGALSLSPGLVAALGHNSTDSEKAEVAASLLFGANEEARRQVVAALLHNATTAEKIRAIESVFYSADSAARTEAALALLKGLDEDAMAATTAPPEL